MKSGRQAESAAFLPYRIRVSKALAAERAWQFAQKSCVEDNFVPYLTMHNKAMQKWGELQ